MDIGFGYFEVACHGGDAFIVFVRGEDHQRAVDSDLRLLHRPRYIGAYSHYKRTETQVRGEIESIVRIGGRARV